MATNKNTQNSEAQQEKKGTTEDPPTNLVKQNEPSKDAGTEVKVPKEAVENYKQAGREGEE